MKLIASKFSNESGIGPVNLLELKSLKEKDEVYYDKETIEHSLKITPLIQLTEFLNFPFYQ